MAWNTWTVTLQLVHFAERIGLKLATFTVVNLISIIIYALITVRLLYFFLVQLRVATAFSYNLFVTSGRHSQKKGTDVGEPTRGSASKFLTFQKFIQLSDSCSGRDDRSLPLPCTPHGK